MKRKKPGNRPRLWKVRQDALSSADGLILKAECLAGTQASEPKKARDTVMQVALFYEAAAQAYRRGSLGLMERRAWTLATECYRQFGHVSGAERCDQQRSAVIPYWEDDSEPTARE
jgi:hypothetical protein